jgi:hypothetical protein
MTTSSRFRLLFCGAAALLVLGVAFAPAPLAFEGQVVYKMTFNTGQQLPPEAQAMMQNMMHSAMELSFKGQKVATLIKSGNGNVVNQTLTDNATGQVYVIDHRQRKILQYADTIGQTTAAGQFSFNTTTETRTLLGYSCKKSVMKFTAEGRTQTFDLWGTTGIMPSLPSTQRRQYDPYMAAITSGQAGFPLLMETQLPEMPGAKMVIEATSVSTTAPAADLFELPAGYTTTVARNQDEINDFYRRQAMGGMGGR